MNTQLPIDIGSTLELFVDHFLIDRIAGDARLTLHHPQPREVALNMDKPWEGNAALYVTTLADGPRYRMYYRPWHIDVTRSGSESNLTQDARKRVCLAESADGITWSRVRAGHIEFNGSTDNNIVWEGAGEEQKGVGGFSPFIDANPDCLPEQRYKAVGAQSRATTAGLYALSSQDGLQWRLMNDAPVITDGKFDSQNLAFWDAVRGEYRAYIRDFYGYDDHFSNGVRGIKTTTSPDFLTWSDPEWLVYPGSPDEQLYTNQVIPYYRAPHIFVGFPTRYVERPWCPEVEDLPEPEHRKLRAEFLERAGAALTDGLFMTSRDGKVFKRWNEAFLRPGPQLEGNWTYGDNYQSWGLIETPSAPTGAPPELSFFSSEGYWRGSGNRLRRFTLRIDGFVSFSASAAGGVLVTKPLTFTGRQLLLNFATSASAPVRVEIQDADGNPLDGFREEECVPVLGDELARRVRWKGGASVASVAGKPVRLRFALADADLYSFQFTDGEDTR